MGVYDEVRCKYPLPEGDEAAQDLVFQTKDFDNALQQYTITKQGRLIHHETEWFMDEEVESMWGGPGLSARHRGDYDLDYHGDLNIYGGNVEPIEYDYTVRFTHGTVEWIKRVGDSEQPIAKE